MWVEVAHRPRMNCGLRVGKSPEATEYISGRNDLGYNTVKVEAYIKHMQGRSMTFWCVYYHVVWATKNRTPLISQPVENKLYPYLIGKAASLDAKIHAIGGIADHVHIAVSIPPKLAISKFVKRIKGSSSYHMNRTILEDAGRFRWQKGYGVFSTGKKELQRVIAYVRNQKQHHRQNNLVKEYEKCREVPTRE
jgi:putative transposase